MKYQIRCAGLPLAVYREVATHLRQVDGVQTELVPQRSPQFDYAQSQIDSLWVSYDDSTPQVSERVRQILAYYSDRYGIWETIESY
ncbi:MAG: hypothetical protein IGS48_04440 [Oscillatoriales cyanobacterium C42_A2020_001]|nr:hypothetical protein [Leptolyngbyaceae cyanobacterium C42_A2020_001]